MKIVNICHKCKKHSCCIPARYSGIVYDFIEEYITDNGVIFVKKCKRYESNTIRGSIRHNT